jgi:hypothetical protein
MQSILICFIILVCPIASACPFYTSTPRLNFTTFTSALVYANITGFPLHVCANSAIPATEILPIINFPLQVVGDYDPIFQDYAVLQLERPDVRPVFIVTSAVVSFQTLQFAFNQTLFLVNGTGLLSLQDCTTWTGRAAVLVETVAGTFGTVGFSGERVIFADVSIGIHQVTGPVTCIGCFFIRPRLAGISCSSSVTAAFSIMYGAFNGDSQFITLLPEGPQAAVDFGTYPPLVLPTNWARAGKNFLFPLCSNSCVEPSQSPLPDFGSGGGSGGGSTTSSGGKKEANAWTITLVVLLALVFFVVLVVGFTRK